MYGESIRSVLSSRSGISISMEDEWIDLMQKVISDNTPSLSDVCQFTTAMWMSFLWRQHEESSGMESLHSLLSIWMRQ